jgi:dTDP-glucose 4,6-dehydratase
MTLIVTGGAGFIGSHYVQQRLARSDERARIVVLDALVGGGRRENLADWSGDERLELVVGDVCDRALLDALFATHRPRAVLHFAAQTHVDRSIADAAPFVRTNVQGMFTLLEAARAYWHTLPDAERAAFRLLQVGTDEVYGSLPPDAPPLAEGAPYAPNNPYAATKAAADHLARAWHVTYGLPVLTTHGGNNLGPRQAAEKFVPRLVACALARAPLPLYGDGRQRRDWIDVRDHVAALDAVLARGRPGEVYHVGAAGGERSNAEVAERVCALLDGLRPDPAGPYRRLITRVPDRPGHDRRYAIDAGKLTRELGWRPHHTFDDTLAHTVRWYLDHPAWRVQ